MAGDADADDLREATDAERTAVSEALGAATALAEKEGTALSEQATERARQTLHAVALDQEVREEFERGRLTTDHDAPGLGELVLGDVKPSGKGKARKKKQSAEREQAKQRRERAQVRRGRGEEADLTPRGRRARGGGGPQGGLARAARPRARYRSARAGDLGGRGRRRAARRSAGRLKGSNEGGRASPRAPAARRRPRRDAPTPTSKSPQRAEDFPATGTRTLADALAASRCASE